MTPNEPGNPERLTGANGSPPAMRFNNRNFVRGLFLMAIALGFGLVAVKNYTIGEFSRSGPGMFPVMISSFLFVILFLSMALLDRQEYQHSIDDYSRSQALTAQ